MIRIAFTLLIATVAGALTFGAAASLNISAPGLGSGAATVSSCHPGEVDLVVDYRLNEADPRLVDGLDVSAIDSGCDGGRLHYVVSDDAAEPATLDIGDVGIATSTATVSFDTALEASAIGEIAFTIVG